MKKRFLLNGHRLLTLIAYCLPCLIAFGVLLFFGHGRYVNARDDVRDQVLCSPFKLDSSECEEKLDIFRSSNHDELKNPDSMTLEEYEIEKFELSSKRDHFDNEIYRHWVGNYAYILTLTLIPFLVLGIGLAYSNKVQRKLTMLGLNYTTEIRRFATRNWGMKYIVAFIIAFGWTYVFFPVGQKATIIYSYEQELSLSQEDTDAPFADTTLPILFRVTESPILNLVIPFLGWYLYLLSYFLHKLYKNDVLGSRVYALLFRKFLFVFGVALALTPSGDQSLIAVFIISYLPLSTPSILKELGVNLLTDGSNLQGDLLTLPGISRWDVFRLEEEGISDIASLATANQSELLETLPKDPSQVNLWVDIAILMTVLGTNKYNEIKKLSLTASYFVRRLNNDEQFVNDLEEKHNIKNAPELVKIISETFSVDLS